MYIVLQWGKLFFLILLRFYGWSKWVRILLFYATLNRGIGDIPNSILMLVALLQ